MEWIIAGLIGGILGVVGGMIQNQGQQDSADKQMAFQADQNATAVQRRVEDLQRAGLNPALAYSGAAGSGSGAQATIGNVGMAGMSGASSALQSKQMMEQLDLQTAQTGADIKVKQAQRKLTDQQTQESQARTGESQARANEAQRVYEFNKQWQPFMGRQVEADTLVKGADAAEAKNRKTFADFMGPAQPAIGAVTSSAKAIEALKKLRH